LGTPRGLTPVKLAPYTPLSVRDKYELYHARIDEKEVPDIESGRKTNQCDRNQPLSARMRVPEQFLLRLQPGSVLYSGFSSRGNAVGKGNFNRSKLMWLTPERRQSFRYAWSRRGERDTKLGAGGASIIYHATTKRVLKLLDFGQYETVTWLAEQCSHTQGLSERCSDEFEDYGTDNIGALLKQAFPGPGQRESRTSKDICIFLTLMETFDVDGYYAPPLGTLEQEVMLSRKALLQDITMQREVLYYMDYDKSWDECVSKKGKKVCADQAERTYKAQGNLEGWQVF